MPFNSGQPAQYQQHQPNWMPAGAQAQQWDLLTQLLGLGSPSGEQQAANAPAPPSRPPAGTRAGKDFDAFWKKNLEGIAAKGGMGSPGNAAGGASDPLARLTQFFGPLSQGPTALQRQSSNQISQYLNQPAPEQRAFDTSMPALQGILGSAPGSQMMDALNPHFQRNLAQASSQGARFSSGNDILRSRAVDDYNLLAAQAFQQGQQAQLQAAQQLGMLGSSAGQNPFSRLMGANQVGQQEWQQQDQETQRRLQILMGLLSTAQGTAFNQPIMQTSPYQPGLFQQLLAGGLPLLGQWLGGRGGGGANSTYGARR